MLRRLSLPAAFFVFMLSAVLLFAVACSAPSPEPDAVAFQETPEQKEQRMSWYKEAKFGMFIHWGPYSALAGEWNGKKVEVGDIAEWIMQRLEIPRDDYREIAKDFNPVEFDAEGIVRLAKDAGMRYLIFTSKHHDGFAMYHSKVSKYNIIDWTPYDSDPLRELAEECRREGIRFGFYYSHREDWDEPFAYGNTWDFDFDPEKDLKTFEEKYLETKAKPQLRELLTSYGPISLVWFDRGIYTQDQARDFAQIVRGLQPQCIINGRIGNYGKELLGDYQNLSDNGMPPGGIEEYWETPQTHNHTWGFSKFDTEWKSTAEVVRRLVEIVSKGGNYLLNIGPDGLGRVPQPSVETLTGVGEWVRANGESVYGATASPFPEIPWGYCTVNGSKLYLHVFDWPENGLLQLKGLRNKVLKVATLANRERALSFKQDTGVVEIKVPREPLDPINSVLVMEIEGTAEVDPVVVTQREDGVYALDFLSAVTQGAAVKRFNREGEWHISKWTGPGDGITWHVDVASPGEFEVRITYAANEGWVGQDFAIEAGGTQLAAKVEKTGDWYQYQSFSLGKISLAQAGAQTVRLFPKSSVPENLMYFKEMELLPATP